MVTPLEVEGDLNDEASSVEASLSPGADSCYFGFVGDAGQELGVQLVDAAVRSDDQGEQGGIFFLCHPLFFSSKETSDSRHTFLTLGPPCALMST